MRQKEGEAVYRKTLNPKPKTLNPKVTPVSGRRRQELCIIKLGEKEVERKLLEMERRLEKEEVASISDDKEVERCPSPPLPPPPSLENKKEISDDNIIKRFFPSPSLTLF
jgi:hypothetical protein